MTKKDEIEIKYYTQKEVNLETKTITSLSSKLYNKGIILVPLF